MYIAKSINYMNMQICFIKLAINQWIFMKTAIKSQIY